MDPKHFVSYTTTNCLLKYTLSLSVLLSSAVRQSLTVLIAPF